MANRLAPTGDINIATRSTMPFGLSTLNPRLALALTFIIVATDAALAQIVETCPYNIAYNIGEIICYFPVSKGVTWITLSLPDNALGVALVIAGMLENHVVIANHIEHFGMRVVNLPVAVPGTESLGNWTCVVYFLYGFLQLSGGIDHADVLTFYYFVANTP